MRAFISNWQTTLPGILMLAIGVIRSVATGQIDTVDIYAGLTGIGLIASKDATK